MGAEQSAILVCTQTGKPEPALKLTNSEQFFQLYFDKIVENTLAPKTGPVTEALLHLIRNMPQQPLANNEQLEHNSEPIEQDSGFENDEHDADTTPPLASEEFSDSDISTSTIYNNDESEFELIQLEFMDFEPLDLYCLADPNLALEQEFIIRVPELNIDEDD
ncbi:uncharacterized protein LOC108607571 [Drosophila busckii]|uniref:uncharacterized protein LOC108607571 n=1 Tax=Drosophila busckii TaxID=30019 RepID=UPI00083F3B1A|nr:uncharacterized protein LOC108607571 [Drosophila busckii]